MACRTYSSLLLTLLVAITTVCGQDLTITPKVQYIDEGLEIDFTCLVPSPLLAGNSEILVVLKRQTTEDEGLLLAQNQAVIQGTYRKRTIITPIANDDGHAIGFAIKISGSIPQDSGEFGCAKSVAGVMGEPVYSKVFIKKQVQTLQMYTVAPNGTEYPLENGKKYQLTKKDELRLMCRATGSVPAAKVSAMLGVQDISKQLFTASSETVLVQDDGGLHMSIYAYDTTLISNDPLDIQVPQTVSCTAEVEGLEGAKTFSIETKFKHKPVIQCNTSVSREQANDVSLDCRLAANPALDNVFWVIRLPTGINITVTDLTDHSSYHTKTENKGNYTVSKLFIDQIFKNHFQNEYFLFAENAEGSTQVEAILEKDPNAGEVGGGASTLAASAILFLTTAILRLL